ARDDRPARGDRRVDDPPRPPTDDRAVHDGGRSRAGRRRRVISRRCATMAAVTAVPARLERFFVSGSATQELAARLRAAGHRAYLVGGSVRDAMLDRDIVDVDIATDA